MNKKVAVVSKQHVPTVDAIINRIGGAEFVQCGDDLKDFDLIVGINQSEGVDINVHHSLLPAFNTEEPIRDAILAGVKVSGITIYYTNPFKIIAQYPVFITNDKHFEDIQAEMQYLEQTIYPLVIEKILNNEQFDIKDLLHKACSNCSGCGGCS